MRFYVKKNTPGRIIKRFQVNGNNTACSYFIYYFIHWWLQKGLQDSAYQNYKILLVFYPGRRLREAYSQERIKNFVKWGALFYFFLTSCSVRYFLFIFIFFGLKLFSSSQNPDTLYVNYFSQAAFANDENGDVKGLEMDIIREYVIWLKTKKQVTTPIKPVKFTDWSLFYTKTKEGPKNTIGLGSVTLNAERLKDIDFTSAYLKNVSFCITNGNVPEIKTKTPDEIVKVLGHMSAVTLTNSTLNKHLLELKKMYIPDLKINLQLNEVKILDEISRNILVFGYVDAVSFWFYLKNNPTRFLKTQKVLNRSDEELAFILPKNSPHKALYNEFFNGATGFKKNKNYRAILEKHLGTYMTQNMAIN